MCLTPITLKRNYNKMDGTTTSVVPCGKCPACLKRRSDAWSFRLYEELKVSESAHFCTFTYENQPLTNDGKPTLRKKDFQDFIKRLRKRVKNNKIKYYACGEYGTTTKRPHYHAIVFNVNPKFIQQHFDATWKHGHFRIDPCNMATIKYVTKYMHKPKIEITDSRQPEFALMSKKMGLSYLTPSMVKHHTEKLIGCVTLKGGALQGLPRYFKEKIFTKDERKQIAEEGKELAKLNILENFTDQYELIQWKKDKFRQHEKRNNTERNSI